MTDKQVFINEVFKLVAILETGGDVIFSRIWLTVKTYGILYLISTGINTSRDLLTGTYGSKPNMTKKLKFLEEKGFIKRTIDPADKRVFRFHLTQKALWSLKIIAPIYEKSIAALFKGVDDAILQKSLWIIATILENMKSLKPLRNSQDIDAQQPT